jgi:hypothetical protein
MTRILTPLRRYAPTFLVVDVRLLARSARECAHFLYVHYVEKIAAISFVVARGASPPGFSGSVSEKVRYRSVTLGWRVSCERESEEYAARRS